MNLMRN